jgi:hypothetical protein
MSNPIIAKKLSKRQKPDSEESDETPKKKNKRYPWELASR